MDGRGPDLRLRDLLAALNVPKSTVRDWLADFAAFIPTVQDGAIVYYRAEALGVLRTVQELRAAGQSKAQIVRSLAGRGYPMNAEPAVAVDTAATSWGAHVQTVAALSDLSARLIDLEQTVAQLREELAASARRRRAWWPF